MTTAQSTAKIKGYCGLKSLSVTSEDIRFTTKGDTLYAITLEWPKDGVLNVITLSKGAGVNVNSVNLLGHEDALKWTQTAGGLEVTLPAKQPCDYAYSLKVLTK